MTFIQRFGSSLNLNIHFHTLFTDGVFVKDDGRYDFHKLPAPTQEELVSLAHKIKQKISKKAAKLAEGKEGAQSSFEEFAIREFSASSIEQKSSFGKSRGQKLRRYGIQGLEVDPESSDPFTANVEGFSLNARVWIPSNDRKKLEQLIRYMARGPIATERLSQSISGDLIYKMKSPWRDGTTHVSFSPLDFIARLVALMPPPRMNMIRYHGVFAPNFSDRKLIVPKPQVSQQSIELAIPSSMAPENVKRERMRWAEMLKRTFKIDVTICPKCTGRLEQIAVIKDQVVAKAILESIKEVTIVQLLELTKERGPPAEQLRIEDYNFDQRHSW